MASPAKMKLAVTGCPRNCAEALCKDLGVVAVDGGRWEIYVGGAAGAHIRKGDLLATVDSRGRGDDADRPLPAVLPRERATGSSAPTAGCRGSGIEHIRAVVVDDADGIAARLDAAIAKSRATPTATRGWTAGAGDARASSGRRCRCAVLPQVPVR